MITKTFTITATEDTMAKLERFLALMHYNAGHSNFFGMPFDGDGHELLKVDPAPPSELRKLVHAVGDYSGDLEYATNRGYAIKKFDTDTKVAYRIDAIGVYKYNPQDPESIKLIEKF